MELQLGLQFHELIYLKNKELQDKKKGQKLNKKSLSHNGWLMAPISTKFVADLKRLAEIPRRMKEFEELGKLINKRF